MAKSARRIVAALSSSLRPRKREARSGEGREIKRRTIEDQKVKDPGMKSTTLAGRQYSEPDEIWRLPRSYSLKIRSALYIAEGKRKRKRENKDVLERNCLYRTLLCTFITPMSFSKNEL